MTMTEPKLDEPVPDARPHPGGKSAAHLVETPDGWVLTLSVDARTAVQLRKELGRGRHSNWVALQNFEVSITPNLVPGGPFELSAVEILVD